MKKVSADLLARLPRTLFVGARMEDWDLIKDLPCGHPFKVVYLACMAGIATYSDGQLELLINTVEQHDLAGVGNAVHINTCEICRQKLLNLLVWYQTSLQVFDDMASPTKKPLTAEWYAQHGVRLAGALAERRLTLHDLLTRDQTRLWIYLSSIPGFGPRSFNKLMDAIEQYRSPAN